jgi:DnaJ family protein A protein 2
MDPYEVLGVPKDATQATIKKAYLKLAKMYHPDKNPDGAHAEKFKEISAAYDILGNEEKKKLYDQYGEEGLNAGGPPPSHQDLFEGLFGGFFGGGGGGRRGGPRRGEDMAYKLQVTLKELYNGKTTKLRATRNVVCQKCTGTGSKRPGVEATCKTCNGRGVRVILRQLGPGMMQRMEAACPDCQGTGETISEKDRCGKCKGKKVSPEPLDLEVNIEKGMANGQKITFHGKSNEEPGVTPGDIVIILVEREDPEIRFIRQGDDLILKRDLSLSEALTGYSFPMTHLDDRTLIIQSQPNDIVKPGDIRVIEGEGFPKFKNPFLKGNMYIKFNIVFPQPDQLDEEAKKKLVDLLPPKPAPEMDIDGVEHEECIAKPFREGIDEIGTRSTDYRDATASDDEEQQGPGCVHQ